MTPSTFTVGQVGRAVPATEMFSGVFSCLVQVVNSVCVAEDFPTLMMRLRCSSQVASWTMQLLMAVHACSGWTTEDMMVMSSA